MKYDLASLVRNFRVEGRFLDGEPYGSGHINDSFLVHIVNNISKKYLLQRVNHHVFRNIPLLMRNIEIVTRHVQKKTAKGPDSGSELKFLDFIPAQDGKYYYKDSRGNYWRMLIFLENSQSYDTVDCPEKAYTGGKMFGRFLALLADLPPESLSETIPNFHNVEKRLETFFKSVREDPLQRVKEALEEIEIVNARAEEMKCINRLGREGRIPERVTHNDTKFNNILFDSAGRAVCVVDLDTVMPGYIHYDFGDAVRTSANTGAEDEKDLAKVSMDIQLFQAFSTGFLQETRTFLTKTEIEHLAFSAKLLTFIIGLRFLTDFIDGDKYFKIHHDRHNLQRTRAQFKLLKSMDEQYAEMQAIIKKLTEA